MNPFFTVGTCVSGSKSIWRAKRHINASLPELCILQFGKMIGLCLGEGTVGSTGSGGSVNERRRFSKERVVPDDRGLLVFGWSIGVRNPVVKRFRSYAAVSMMRTLCGSPSESWARTAERCRTYLFPSPLIVADHRWLRGRQEPKYWVWFRNRDLRASYREWKLSGLKGGMELPDNRLHDLW